MLDWLRAHAPWLAPVIVFGLIVFVHELGHFLAAKAFGVYAPRFSIGFGPTLFSRRVGETEYVLAALPLGGYVRMASRDDEAMALIEGGSEQPHAAAAGHPGELSEAVGEAAGESPPKDWDPNAMMPFGPKPVPEHRWFESKSIPKRVAILLAGVTMNIVLAFVVEVFIASHFGRSENPTRVVGSVDSALAPAALVAAVRPGDTVVAVNGTRVESWNDVVGGLLDASGDTVRLTTSRGTVALYADAPGTEGRAKLASALGVRTAPVIESLQPGKPGAKAGLQPGDSVVAANGTPITDFDDLVRVIGPSAGRPVALDLMRAGRMARVTVVPAAESATDGSGKSISVGRIGAVPPSYRHAISFGEAVSDGGRATWAIAALVGTSLKNLATRRASLSELGGPIAIARTSVAAARSGAFDLLGLIALLSVNLAIFNLLPVPVLDGGQIVLTLAEAAKGSPFSIRARNAITIAGLVTVGLLFCLVMFNDTIRRMV